MNPTPLFNLSRLVYLVCTNAVIDFEPGLSTTKQGGMNEVRY
jgi:hypothetical protein